MPGSATLAWLVGVGGFAHIIVGSAQALFLVMTGALSFGEYLTRFMLPRCSAIPSGV